MKLAKMLLLIVERPDGVALPGEFHLRYVHRSDVVGFLEKAGEA